MKKNRKCYLCGNNKIFKRKGRVRDNSELKVLECSECGLVFLSSFEHIKKNYYSESRMNDDPLGKRLPIEYEMDEKRRIDFCKNFIKGKKILDFGCGMGDFLRDCSFDADEVCGIEPDFKAVKKLDKEGLKIFKRIEDIPAEKKFDIVTMFHVLEYLPDTISELKKLKNIIDDRGMLIIEVPNSEEALISLYNNKGFLNFYWSCHLFLFNEKTLRDSLVKAGYIVQEIKQIQRYPLSNHLYWLANNKPGGHLLWKFMDSNTMNDEYANKLASIGKCDTLIATAVKGGLNG